MTERDVWTAERGRARVNLGQRGSSHGKHRRWKRAGGEAAQYVAGERSLARQKAADALNLVNLEHFCETLVLTRVWAVLIKQV